MGCLSQITQVGNEVGSLGQGPAVTMKTGVPRLTRTASRVKGWEHWEDEPGSWVIGSKCLLKCHLNGVEVVQVVLDSGAQVSFVGKS